MAAHPRILSGHGNADRRMVGGAVARSCRRAHAAARLYFILRAKPILPFDWSCLRYLSVGGRMRSGGKSPRRAVDRGGRKDSLYTRSLHPVVLDRNPRARQFSPRPAEAWQAAARQSATTSPPLFARVAVVGGIAVLILLLFVTVRPWLPDLTIIRHADASRTTPGTSASFRSYVGSPAA
jgi:hypothetical protein